MTQQNTASAEETASAAEELSGQTESLQGILSKFNLKGGDGEYLEPVRQRVAEPVKGRRPKPGKEQLSKPRGLIELDGFGRY